MSPPPRKVCNIFLNPSPKICYLIYGWTLIKISFLRLLHPSIHPLILFLVFLPFVIFVLFLLYIFFFIFVPCVLFFSALSALLCPWCFTLASLSSSFSSSWSPFSSSFFWSDLTNPDSTFHIKPFRNYQIRTKSVIKET